MQVPAKREYTGFKHHAKVHTFRLGTALLTWAILVSLFFYRPEVIRWAMRSGTHAIESIGDALPNYWGAQVEILLRELGGFLWLQITVAILAVRAFLSLIAMLWRRRQ
jgi:hypothetical protein